MVKILLVALLPLFMSGSNAYTTQSTAQNPTDGLQPTVSHRKVQETITSILGYYAYNKVELTDSLSAKVWAAFLKEVDPNKLYFTQSEINNFNVHRLKVDDYLRSGELAAPYEVYNLFLKKFKERSKYINAVLDRPFDFSTNESYQTDRDKEAWASTDAQLDDLWRKIIKGQALDLKLSNKPDSTIATTLKNRYKNVNKYYEKFKSEQVFQAYMNSLAETIDPHTNYFSPTSADNFRIDMAQSLEGIGAVLTFDNEYVKINEIIPGGPAFKGKQLQKNDKIVAVAQGDTGAFTDIVGWITEDAVKLIRGPKGSVVRLQIIPADAPAGSATKEYRIVREKVKLEDQVAKSEILQFKNNNKDYKFGLITIPMFYRDFEGAQKREEEFKSTTRDVQAFLGKFANEKVDGVIIDLRNNGGGSLTEAVNLTGLFIPKGPVVQQRESNGEIQVHEDTDPNQYYAGPVAVLINRFSASASEIFAGAIQDYKRGIVLGEQSYGKGTVQSLIDLSQFLPREKEKLGQLKLTMAKFYRINGSSTQHIGVTPDIEFPSGFSASEYGESSMPNALPWDQINSTKYSYSTEINDKLLKTLRDNYSLRLKTDKELIKLSEDVVEFLKMKENTMVSLQEDVRKKEREANEAKRKASKLNNDTTDKTADTYLAETKNILVDLISNSAKKNSKDKIAKI
jgi:carboxyl-terminal processing protease